MATKIVAVAALLLALAPPAGAGDARSGLCPEGFNESFNANGVGCTLCSAQTDCEVGCLVPPPCVCTPGDTACCASNPCCDNCLGAKPLRCTTASCECSPESCCFVVCPATVPTPASSTTGLLVLAGTLFAFGIGALRVVSRRAASPALRGRGSVRSKRDWLA